MIRVFRVAAAAAACFVSAAGGVSAAASPPAGWLIKANDYRELTTAGYGGTFQWTACGGPVNDWPENSGNTIPCHAGQPIIYADYQLFRRQVLDGYLKRMSNWAVIDYETWPQTPAWQQAHPLYNIKRTEQLANAYGINTIDAPGGRRTWAQFQSYDAEAAKYGATVVSVQSQFGTRHPYAVFKPFLSGAIRQIRAVSKTVPVLAGISPDAGGQPATADQMVTSWRIAVNRGVAGFWLNAYQWQPPRGHGCATTGCVGTVLAFLSRIS
jgi:hypothetical protein